MSLTSYSGGASLSSTRWLSSPIITIRVGPTKQEFCIHKDLLCSCSMYFTKALSGRFMEAQTHIVELEDMHPVLFRVFITFLYTDKLAHESPYSSIPSFDDLNETLKEYHPYEKEEDENQDNTEDEEDDVDVLSQFKEETPESWTYLILAGLFVLGDRLDAATFKRQVLDTIAGKTDTFFATPHDSAILYAYANTTKNSRLRRLLVHINAYQTSFEKSHHTWNHMPVEFLTAVMVTMGRRLPVMQCSSCFKKAIHANKIEKLVIDDVAIEDGDLPPFKYDLCFYHEHKDEDEEETCRETRLSRMDLESSEDMGQSPEL